MTEEIRRSRLTEIAMLALLIALGAMLFATNRWITIIDDEATIITTATQPVQETLHAFSSGEGLHEHPPLYDLILHFWLQITGERFVTLRLPAILFYLFGLALLSRCAEEIGGLRSAWAVLWMGALWPFGFHYGRLAAWYSFCFLLVGWLTLVYLRLLRRPSVRRLCGFLLSAAALIYTNYFGWAFLACLAADYVIRKRQEWLRAMAVIASCGLVLAIAYIPLWRAFLLEVRNGTNFAQPITTKILLGGFHLYNAFVSESAAPWFLWLGIPAGICVAICLATALKHAPSDARKFLVYSLVLMVAMALLGIISAKRMLPVAAWILLPVALGVNAAPRGRPRRIFVGALLGVAAIGWFGIFSRQYYSAPRFIEPWERVASEAGNRLLSPSVGGYVVGNNPSFFFYLSYALPALHRSDGTREWQPVRIQGVFDAEEWNELKLSKQGLPIYFVRGAPGPLREGPAWDAETQLDSQCHLDSEKQILRDSASSLKARFFPELGDLPWRVRVLEYTCPGVRLRNLL
ncbi:MAG: glycosyltransferase family 39 protein [Candidatus Acidiferrales bacterium]